MSKVPGRLHATGGVLFILCGIAQAACAIFYQAFPPAFFMIPAGLLFLFVAFAKEQPAA